MIRETMNEYLTTYDELTAEIAGFGQRIQEIANQELYREKVRKPECFLGFGTHSALSLIVETGDFLRFRKGNVYVYAAYLGLAPVNTPVPKAATGLELRKRAIPICAVC